MDIELAQGFDRHLRRVATLEHPGDHFAGLTSHAVVIDRQGRNGAAGDRIGIGGKYGQPVLPANLDDRFECRHNRIVGRDVNGIGPTDQAARRLGNSGRGRHRCLLDMQTAQGSLLAQNLDDSDGIGFTGVVDHADAPGLGNKGKDQVELTADRTHVRGPGDMAAGMLQLLDQPGTDRIGNRREHNGNVADRLGARLGRRGGNRHHHVRLFAQDLPGDQVGRGDVPLGDVVMKGHRKALSFQFILHALTQGIERRMFDNLVERDHIFARLGQSRQHQQHQQPDHNSFHKNLRSPVYPGKKSVQSMRTDTGRSSHHLRATKNQLVTLFS